MHDYRQADLEPRVRCLCDFAVKVTREPSGITVADVTSSARRAGATRRSTTRCRSISYFNYINRIADAVGIDDEPEWAPH